MLSQLAVELRKYRPGDAAFFKLFDKRLQLTRNLVSLATRMRLTQQSRIKPSVAGHMQVGRRLWDSARPPGQRLDG